MKWYKTVTLKTTSGSKINLPKDVWKNLGWKPNDKIKLNYYFSGPTYDGGPVGISVSKED